MASSSNWLSGVNVVLVMAYGSLVFVLLFIFVKRQIMRFAMKSRRGPHVPVGHNAPKDLKEEIDIRLSRVQDIKYEPQLLADDDARLLQLETQGNLNCYNYLYRMKALDAIRASGKLTGMTDELEQVSWCRYLLRDPVSCRRPPSPFLNGQELPLLPAGPPERQHALQGRAQGPHRHPAGWLRDGPLRDRGLWPERVPALPGGPERAGQRGQSTRWELSATAPVRSQRPHSVS
ncbi:protein C1orf43 homolog isoform X2 [Pteropus medius]|uniref:protein C1orf43 homolog isoform X2 n=1 Tax=Pteropus vampyrus TaxID=132908 RepID=UPI00196AEBA9|nr:protein C1orf43 homolog isoform X2 [Pteropus giganteus]